MSNIVSSILSSFRAGIVAIGLDGTVAYVNPIGAKILEGCPLKEGENIHGRAGDNSFFRVLSEAISMNYLPTRVEVELPGKEGDRQFLGFTLSDLKDGEKRVGICAFFKDLTQVEMAEENEKLNQRLSEERANRIAASLAASGLPKQQITAKGFGSSRPVASNDSEEGRRRNRRVEVVIEK